MRSKCFYLPVSARAEGSKRFYSSNQPARRVQNVFICPFSPRGGFKTFLFARSARAEGSKRFYSSNQPERRVQNVFICPFQPERTNLYIKISPHGLNEHILTLKSPHAGCLDIFLRQNLFTRADWADFYVKIPHKCNDSAFFAVNSLTAEKIMYFIEVLP
jgi:hypothetical protein